MTLELTLRFILSRKVRFSVSQLGRQMVKIGEIAKRLAVSTDTLRYYEKQGILNSSARSESGYRLYSEQDIAQLSFVLRAKDVGFTLNEIKELLAIKVDKQSHSCEQVKHFTSEKITQVERKIAELNTILNSLKLLHKSCCGGNEPAVHCSILSALEAQNDAR